MPPPSDDAVRQLFAGRSEDVVDLAVQARGLIRSVVPDAVEELDQAAKLLAFTFRPGTYTGLIVGIVAQRAWVNLMFSRGVELLAIDTTQLLEGTGKRARHVKIYDAERLRDPALSQLIARAAARTPR